jgi:hypothetical protein
MLRTVIVARAMRLMAFILRVATLPHALVPTVRVFDFHFAFSTSALFFVCGRTQKLLCEVFPLVSPFPLSASRPTRTNKQHLVKETRLRRIASDEGTSFAIVFTSDC